MERKLKVALVWAFSQDYLNDLYQRHPGLGAKTYDVQLESTIRDYYGWPPSVGVRMKEQGHDARLFLINSAPLQQAWARENAFPFPTDGWESSVSLEQIRRFKPDVVWIGSMFKYFGTYLAEARNWCRLVVAWVACPIPAGLHVDNVDMFLTSHANIRQKLEESGRPAYVVLPSFDRRTLDSAIARPTRTQSACFVGSLLSGQRRRIDLLRTLDRNIPLDLYLAKPTLSRQSLSVAGLRAHLGSVPLYRKSKGTAYGMQMYQLFRDFQLTINVHGEVAGGVAGNIRMFEATGMGCALVTEAAPNIRQIFDPDTEVVTYRNAAELVEKSRYLLANPVAAAEIGSRGQERTLRTHNSTLRASEILDIMTRALISSRGRK